MSTKTIDEAALEPITCREFMAGSDDIDRPRFAVAVALPERDWTCYRLKPDALDEALAADIVRIDPARSCSLEVASACGEISRQLVLHALRVVVRASLADNRAPLPLIGPEAYARSFSTPITERLPGSVRVHLTPREDRARTVYAEVPLSESLASWMRECSLSGEACAGFQFVAMSCVRALGRVLVPRTTRSAESTRR